MHLTPTPSASPAGPQDPRGRLKHLIIIVQENRSFDNLFHAFPGTDSVDVGRSTKGPIRLRPMSLAAGYEIGHEHPAALLAVDGGKMDGFLREGVVPHMGTTAPPDPQYVYAPRTEVAPYWAMARSQVLADRFFAQLDGSFTAHQYLIAGQSANTINVPIGYPWGCDSNANNSVPVINSQGQITGHVFPCFDYKTLADGLDDAGVGWHYYAPAYGQGGYIWSAYDAVRHIRMTNVWNAHVISPQSQVLSDAASGTGLAAVNWVVPAGPDSDHPANQSTSGPAWVASVVDAVGQSPYWKDCAILILWDDWGGLYDHVPPPPGDQFGPGIRVPLIVLSPFAVQGVAHGIYNFGSVMRLVEDAFGLPSLGTIDASAGRFGKDVFDFTQRPRAFPGPFGTPADRLRFMHERPSLQPPDND